VARLTLLGSFDEAWRSSAALAPHRGKLLDLSSRELSALAVLVVLIVVAGMWPTPWLTTMATTVRDVCATVEPPADFL
jgi:NADH:ubiquinone oxidoreductase subunit 4 (subunit M)